MFVPIVLGPESLPRITDVEEAVEAPELAVLSALAHGNDPKGVEVVLAAVAASAGLDEERGKLYCDLVTAGLTESARRAL